MYHLENFTNQFLIAMPGLMDPNFSRTVTYVCEHSSEGAMGIIINRPIEVGLGTMLDQLQINITAPEVRTIPIYLGGPVQIDRGFVLHTGSQTWDSTIKITDNINITTSKDILEAIAQGKGPSQVLIALGYAGWTSGQIEQEISANSWLISHPDSEIIFNTPVEQRWKAAANLIGINIDLLGTSFGHA
ncbi:hypothetical protein TI04_06400 [Achromatium sp. WMS2]|nr:hypothetical protein TI04_06400 [Achromatium sp. WMS2]